MERMTGGSIVAIGCGFGVCVAFQDIALPEKVTILSLLAFVIGAATWLLRTIGGRLVTSIDTKLAPAIEANTKTVGELVTELRVLTEQHETFQRELRDVIKDAIDKRQ